MQPAKIDDAQNPAYPPLSGSDGSSGAFNPTSGLKESFAIALSDGWDGLPYDLSARGTAGTSAGVTSTVAGKTGSIQVRAESNFNVDARALNSTWIAAHENGDNPTYPPETGFFDTFAINVDSDADTTVSVEFSLNEAATMSLDWSFILGVAGSGIAAFDRANYTLSQQGGSTLATGALDGTGSRSVLLGAGSYTLYAIADLSYMRTGSKFDDTFGYSGGLNWSFQAQSPVPEHGTLALAALGLGAGAVRAVRRRA